MTPSDLRALLEKASPGPWHIIVDGVRASRTSTFEGMDDPDVDAFLAVWNLAPLLIELWEVVRDHPAADHDSIAQVIEALEES